MHNNEGERGERDGEKCNVCIQCHLKDCLRVKVQC